MVMEKHPIELKTGGPIGLAPDGSVVSDARGQATSSSEISFIVLFTGPDSLSKKFDLAHEAAS